MYLHNIHRQMNPLYLLYRHRHKQQQQQQQTNEDVLGYMEALFSAFLQILTLTTKRRLKRVFPAALVSIRNVWLLSATTTATELTVFIVLCSKGVRNASTPLLPSVSSGFSRQRKKTDGSLRQSESGFLPRWPISARKGAGRLYKNRGGARDRMRAG